MPKPSFRDIVPPENRSIKKIPLPSREREKEEEPEPRRAPKHHKTKSSHSFKSILATVFIALVAVAGIYFFISQSSGAKIILTPKSQSVPVSVNVTATISASGELPYQTVSYQKDGKLAVPASGEETVQLKASGTIRIFNSFTEKTQKLVANTRFESNGKIFRIKDSATIPGMVGSTPGSVDAVVTADEVGEKYNVGLADFTIPGFKGDPRYEKIFARSAEPISGGFSGTRPKVDPQVMSEARKKIREELESNFVKQIKQNIPSAFVFLNNAYFISFNSMPNATSTEGSVMIVERATFHGVIFKRADLSDVLAKKITDVNVGSSTFEGIDNLTFSLRDASTSMPWQNPSLALSIKGTTTLVSDVDISSLKNALAGKARKDLNLILQGYSGVEKADVIMRPFWNQEFPADKTTLSIILGSTTPTP